MQTIKCVVVGDGAVGKASALLETDQRGLVAYCLAGTDVSSHLVHYQCLPGEYYLCCPVQSLLTRMKQGEYIPTGESHS